MIKPRVCSNARGNIMYYKTKQFAEKLGVSPYTVRYYDKEGLLPFVIRDAHGYRVFTDADINIFTTVLCLKNTNMPLKEIKTYIGLVKEGAATVEQRRVMLIEHQKTVIQQQALIETSLIEIQNKIDKYSSVDAGKQIQSEMAFVNNEKMMALQKYGL
jgi:DNA-binding transcriptional MerR regulator